MQIPPEAQPHRSRKQAKYQRDQTVGSPDEDGGS